MKTIYLSLLVLLVLASFSFAYTDLGGGVCECGSTCSDCSDALNSTTCSNEVRLTTGLSSADTCINDPANFNNKIFDCQNNEITGPTYAPTLTYGIYLDNQKYNVIKNCRISKFHFGIGLYTSSSFNTLINNMVYDSVYYNIHVANSPSNTVTGNELYNANYGVYNENSIRNTITNNNVHNNRYYGLLFSGWSAYNNISGNTVYNHPYDAITFWYTGSYNNVTNNEVYNNTNGIGLYYSNSNKVSGNTARNNSYAGIYLEGTSTNNISANIVYGNQHKVCSPYPPYTCRYEGDGIVLNSGSNSNTLASNSIYNQPSNGISLTSSSSNTISSNSIHDNPSSGIDLSTSSKSNTITSNSIYKNGQSISLSSNSSSNLISGNTISDSNYDAIMLGDSSYNTIANNILSNNKRGITLFFGDSYNYVINNTVYGSSNGDGIRISGSGITTSSYNTITNNRLYKNYNGIFLLEASNNYIADNSIYNNTQFGIQLTTYSNNNTIFRNNLLDSRYAIYLIDDCSGNAITNNNIYNINWYGIEATERSDNNTIANNNISKTYDGIYLYGSSGSIIIGNSISGSTYYGISIYGASFGGVASNSIIDSNSISNSYDGIYLYGTSGSTIARNTISNSTYYGIYLYGTSNNTLTSNIVSNSGYYGIYLSSGSGSGASDNTLTSNSISKSGYYGIYLYGASNNALTRNTFQRNGEGSSSGSDLYVSGSYDGALHLTMTNCLFFNPDGTDYVNLSLSDAVSQSAGEYGFSISRATADPPRKRIQFITPLKISGFSSSESIDSITWSWVDSQVPSGYEGQPLELWKYVEWNQPPWAKQNATPGQGANSFTASNVKPSYNSIFGVYYRIATGIPIIACGDITSPGYYVLDNDLSISSQSCLRIKSSDVTVDCDGYTITNTGSMTYGADGIQIGVYGTQLWNVTIKDCADISGFYAGVSNSNPTWSGLGVNDLTITDVVVSDNGYGMFFTHWSGEVSGLTIRNVEMDNNLYSALYYDVPTGTISNVSITTAPDSYADIQFGWFPDAESCAGMTVEDVTVDGLPMIFANSQITLSDAMVSSVFLCNADGSVINNVDIRARGLNSLYSDNLAITSTYSQAYGSIPFSIYSSDGLTFRGNTPVPTPYSYAGAQIDGRNLLVEQNIFSGYGIFNQGISIYGSGDVTVRDNVIYDINGGSGIIAAAAGTGEPTAVVVSGNSLFSCSGEAINAYAQTSEETINVSNNEIYYSGRGIIAASYGNGPVVLENNVVHENNEGVYIYSSQASVSNDHYYGNGADFIFYAFSPGAPLTLNDVVFDSYAGDYTKYSRVSLSDYVDYGYRISWAEVPDPVPDKRFLSQIMIQNDGMEPIDSIMLKWTDADLAGYYEANFSAWKLNPENWGWTELPGVLDQGANTLTISGYTQDSWQSMLGIFQDTGAPKPVGACMEIKKPGKYYVTTSLYGASVYVPSYGSYACIYVTSPNVDIDCNYNNIANNGVGYAYAVLVDSGKANVTVTNCNIYDYEYGVVMMPGSSGAIAGNQLNNNNNGIVANRAEVDILGNSLNAYSYGYGIGITSIGNSGATGLRTIAYNTVSGYYAGLLLDSNTAQDIRSNNFVNNGNFGAAVVNSQVNITDNVISDNFYYYGLYLLYAGGSTISRNTVANSPSAGIFLQSQGNTGVDVSDNQVYGIWSGPGISIQGGAGNRISNNSIHDTGQFGLSIGASSNNAISGNEIYSNPYGVYDAGTLNDNYTSNKIRDNWEMGFVAGGTDTALSNNEMYGNGNYDIGAFGVGGTFSLEGDHLYHPWGSIMYVQGYGNSRMDNVVIDSPGDNLVDYTNFSLRESGPSYDYGIYWTSSQYVPYAECYSPIAGNALYLSSSGIDSATWHWQDSELGGADENLLALAKGNSVVNSTPDTEANTLSYSNAQWDYYSIQERLPDGIPPTTTISAESGGAPYQFWTWAGWSVQVFLDCQDDVPCGLGCKEVRYCTSQQGFCEPEIPNPAPRFTITDEGITTICYQSEDTSGNVEPYVSCVDAYIDKGPPESSAFLSTPDGDNGWYLYEASFSVESYDTGSGVAATYVCVDQSNTCDPVSENIGGTYGTITEEGTFYIRYMAVDNVGNVENIKVAMVNIDRTDPTATLQPLLEFDGDGLVNLEWESSDSVSGIREVRIYRGSDMIGSFGPILSYVDDRTGDDSQGFTYTAMAVDYAGRTAQSEVRSTTIDLSPPTVPAMQPLPLYTRGTSVVVEWQRAIDAASGVGFYSLYRNEFTTPYTTVEEPDPRGSTPSPRAFTDESVSEGDTYTYAASSTDLAEPSHVSALSDPASTTIDTTPPVTTKSKFPSSPDGNNGWYVTPIGVELICEDAVSGCQETLVGINSPPYMPYSGAFLLSEDGGYTISYYSTDNAGNIEGEQSQYEMLDQTDPETAAYAYSSGQTYDGSWVNQPVEIYLECSDATSGCDRIRYCTGSSECTPSSNYDGQLSISGQGTTYVCYASEDVAGNAEATDCLVTNIDRTEPVTTASGTTSAGDPYSFGTWAKEDVWVSLECTDTLSGCQYTDYCTGSSECAPSMRYEGPLLIAEEGVAFVCYASTDYATNWEQSSCVQVKIDRGGPITTKTLIDSDSDGAPEAFTLSADDGAGSGVDKIYYSVVLAGKPPSFVVYTGQVTLPTNMSAEYEIGFYATDKAGNEGIAQFQRDTPDMCAGAPGNYFGCPGAIKCVVTANKQLGNKPAQQPVYNALCKAYNKADACEKAYHPNAQNIAQNCVAAASCITGPDGICLIGVPQAQYYVLVAANAFPGKYPGHDLGQVETGNSPKQAKLAYLIAPTSSQQEKAKPATSTKKSGSELWIFEPQYSFWNGTEEFYPFLFESDSTWTIDVCVDPPEGYVVVDGEECIHELVANEAKMILFKLVETGSVPGDTTFNFDLTDPSGKTQKYTAKIEARLSKQLAKGKNVEIDEYGRIKKVNQGQGGGKKLEEMVSELVMNNPIVLGIVAVVLGLTAFIVVTRSSAKANKG